MLFIHSAFANQGASMLQSIPFEMNDGSQSSLEKFNGQVVLIVNTASNCGFTSQLGGLRELQERFAGEGFTVLAFPANDFGGQEPGSDEEIKTFCEKKYDINYPLAAKTVVKGADQHPLFQLLTTAENPDFTGNIRWNFEKFIIDRQGNLRGRFRSTTGPNSKSITNRITSLLEERAES
jgi:glutathione peroxidase